MRQCSLMSSEQHVNRCPNAPTHCVYRRRYLLPTGLRLTTGPSVPFFTVPSMCLRGSIVSVHKHSIHLPSRVVDVRRRACVLSYVQLDSEPDVLVYRSRCTVYTAATANNLALCKSINLVYYAAMVRLLVSEHAAMRMLHSSTRAACVSDGFYFSALACLFFLMTVRSTE